MKPILYIGSGKSSNLIKHLNLSDYIVVGVNNTWRHFNSVSPMDIWIHSGDFPYELRPKEKVYNREISYKEYGVTADKAAKILQWNTSSPQHYLGYTIFFLGLYWILMDQTPKEIFLLGFDHDYNVDKVDKWRKNLLPTPQNDFFRKKGQSIPEWANEFFNNMTTDFFYGHGTPDPLRLGDTYIPEKFQIALNSCDKLGTKLYNMSPIVNDVNICPKSHHFLSDIGL